MANVHLTNRTKFSPQVPVIIFVLRKPNIFILQVRGDVLEEKLMIQTNESSKRAQDREGFTLADLAGCYCMQSELTLSPTQLPAL